MGTRVSRGRGTAFPNLMEPAVAVQGVCGSARAVARLRCDVGFVSVGEKVYFVGVRIDGLD